MLDSYKGKKLSNRTVIRKLTHNPNEWQLSMFCNGCPDLDLCGGIASQAGGHCYMHCCGGKAECQTVCRNNQNFKAQFREIGGFDFENVPRVTPVFQLPLHGVAPMILHGKKRQKRVRADIIALKMRDIVDMNNGCLRYSNREALADELKFNSTAKIIVTGIEQDKWVEPWWSLGRARRRPLLKELFNLRFDIFTPPNFSLFCDEPRPSDFSAMKRIAMVQAEFLAAGIPCALHPHIVTEADSNRWIEFIASRPEIQTIAYEFTTGAGHTLVRQRHIDHLIAIAKETRRPLDLIIRGDQRIISNLSPFYRNLVYIDTNAFMKSLRSREIAIRADNQRLNWQSVKTPHDISLDELLQHNVDEVRLSTNMLLSDVA